LKVTLLCVVQPQLQKFLLPQLEVGAVVVLKASASLMKGTFALHCSIGAFMSYFLGFFLSCSYNLYVTGQDFWRALYV
jgi:hypothetical protein